MNSETESPNHIDQVDTLLHELNRTAEAINELEQRLQAAIIRRTYLTDSIADLSSSFNQSFTTLAIKRDRLGLSVEYMRRLLRKQELMNKSKAACELYLASSNSYDEHRNLFDVRVGQIKDSASVSKTFQESLASLSVQVLAAQRERDASEAEYIKFLREIDDNRQATDDLQRSLGDARLLEVIEPRLRGLTQIDIQIKEEDKLIDSIRDDLEKQKCRYRGVMLRLDEVSRDIHRWHAGNT